MQKQNIICFNYYSKNKNIKFFVVIVLKILVVSSSDTTSMKLKIEQNLSTEVRHGICDCYNNQAGRNTL